MKKNKCETCGRSFDLIFKNHQVCNNCWNKHCDGEINFNELFDIDESQEQTELTAFSV